VRFPALGFVTISGLFPRLGLTLPEAAIGGLLFPILLVSAAGYLMLGASADREPAKRSESSAATNEVSLLFDDKLSDVIERSTRVRPPEGHKKIFQEFWMGERSLTVSFWGFCISGWFATIVALSSAAVRLVLLRLSLYLAYLSLALHSSFMGGHRCLAECQCIPIYRCCEILGVGGKSNCRYFESFASSATRHRRCEDAAKIMALLTR
jgi:hypothetical protein